MQTIIPFYLNEMKEFFDIRESQWPNKAFRQDGYPWMEWKYPQPIHDNGVVNVSVAQHPQLPFSNSIKDSSLNWGRGYNFETKKNESDKAEQGQNFQYQWDSVIERKDNINTVFVTGWNEWIAQKADHWRRSLVCGLCNGGILTRYRADEGRI